MRAAEQGFAAVLITEADLANLSLLPSSEPLRRLLARARVVRSDEIPPDVVTMNTLIALLDESSGERRLVRVVFPADADPLAGRLSVLDPLAVRLLGASPGLVIEQPFADGLHRLRVERIVYQPEDSLRTNLVLRR
jgi:regulator of nucleoside diphosphate kinase